MYCISVGYDGNDIDERGAGTRFVVRCYNPFSLDRSVLFRT